jgi:chromosome segregation ATPase
MSKEKETIDYQKGLTFEQVWATIQENHQKFQDRLEKLTDKYDTIFEREAKERQERQKAYEERRKAEAAAEAERRKETEERLKKLDAFVEETSRIVRETTSKMGKLDKRFGEVVEHLVAPNIVEQFNELGYHFNTNYRTNLDISENDQLVSEVDILLENRKTVAVVEVKAKPTKHDIRRHLKRMQIVRRWYCEQYPNIDKDFIGAVAGAVFPEHVKQFAIENGFYVITQTGDTVKIDVPEDFKPRIF